MSKFGFIGPSYTAGSNVIADEECINFYPETIETPGAQAQRSYFGTPGLAVFATFTDGPVRGQCWTGSRLFVASSDTLYEVFADGTQVVRAATLDTFGSPVSIVASNVELLIVAGGRAYCYNLAANTFNDVTVQLAGAPVKARYSDGYFIVMFAGSNKFQISAILDGNTWPGIQVNAVSVFPENIVSIEVSHRELWVIGQQHSQPYQDTGTDEIFDVIPGALIETGGAATFGVDLVDNTVFWISQDIRGARQAWRANGYTPSRISTHAVEAALSSYSADQVSNLVSYSYQDGGHLFWVLYIPGIDCTWVYDVAESMWHKRAEWHPEDGTYGPHRSWNHTYAFGKHLVGDWKTGTLYDMSLNYLDEADPQAASPPQGMTLLFGDVSWGVMRTVDASGIISTLPITSTDPVWIANFSRLRELWGFAKDATGNIYIADLAGNVVYKVDTSFNATAFAGTGVNGYTGDGGPATSAEVGAPGGVALDAAGNLYISQVGTVGGGIDVIRVVNMQSATITVFGQTVAPGNIQTIAGTGTGGYSGDGGLASLAQFRDPFGLAFDATGNLWVADQGNSVVRKIDTSGIVTTVVGTSVQGFSGDGGPALSAQLFEPLCVTFDSTGVLYIADIFNHCIRAVNFTAGAVTVCGVSIAPGVIQTIAGIGGSPGFSGDGGPAISAEMNIPHWVAPDNSGNVYISDTKFNFRIRKVNASGIISTVVGTGVDGNTGDGGPATSAEIGTVPKLVVISSTTPPSQIKKVIRRLRRSPTLVNEMAWVYHSELVVDFATGLGPQPPLLDGDGNPRPPQAMLRWSNNRGSTWSNQHIANCGFAGEYNTRVIWRRLGRSRYRVYELTVSDPIPWAIVDAYLKAA